MNHWKNFVVNENKSIDWVEEQLLNSEESNSIIKQLTEGATPSEFKFYYQKHMAHHILPKLDLSWVKKLSNVFLIRDPQYVLQSYLKKEPQATPEDLGYPQLLKIFNLVKNESRTIPLVMDSKDILLNPKPMMEKLCQSLHVPFDEAMMTWPKGYRDSDGIWANHWYNRVIESTGFSEYKPKEFNLNKEEKRIADACQPYSQELLKHKINV